MSLNTDILPWNCTFFFSRALALTLAGAQFLSNWTCHSSTKLTLSCSILTHGHWISTITLFDMTFISPNIFKISSQLWKPQCREQGRAMRKNVNFKLNWTDHVPLACYRVSVR